MASQTAVRQESSISLKPSAFRSYKAQQVGPASQPDSLESLNDLIQAL